MKKTVWYIRQWPTHVVSINLVESCDQQLDGTPTFRVSNDSDLNSRTIAISQVELFVKELRENWIASHKNDRLEQHT